MSPIKHISNLALLKEKHKMILLVINIRVQRLGQTPGVSAKSANRCTNTKPERIFSLTAIYHQEQAEDPILKLVSEIQFVNDRKT